MSAEVLKEFLVALGFKVDSPGLKRFVAGVEAATKVAVKAGTATTAMGVAIEAAVVKVSKGFEDLYYASQRIHSSVENIKATDYAITQMGGSAQGARAAMEGIANLIRSNPGGESFIRSLGVETRDANGELRDTAGIVSDLGSQFRKMPYYMAKVRANMLGIDDLTLQAMIRGTDEFSSHYHDMAAKVGIDQQAAAKASHEFMVQVRDLLTMLELVFAKVVIGLQSSVGPSMARLSQMLGPIMEAVGRVAGVILGLFGDLDKATGGWSTALLILLGILAPIVTFVGGAAAGVLALVAAVALLIDDFQTWKSGGKSLIDWSAWSVEIGHVMSALQPLFSALQDLGAALARIGAALMKALGPTLGNILRGALEGVAGMIDLITNAVRVLVDLLNGQWGKAWQDAKKGAVQFGQDTAKAFGKFFGDREKPAAQDLPAQQPAARPQALPVDVAKVGKQIVDFFKVQGFTPEQSQGMAAGAFAESHFKADATNPKSGAFGIGQWLGSRKAELFRRYGDHPTLQQQLEFMASELTGSEKMAGGIIRGQQTARGALEAYVKSFMRPGMGPETVGDIARGAAYLAAQTARPVLATSAAAAANANVSINQKTEVTVNGAPDPAKVAGSVVNAQERVNGNLVRNTRGAVR